MSMEQRRGGVKGRNILGNVAEVEQRGPLQHMRGFDKAGILFTDFKAAYPSIFSAWIFNVLQVIGVPSAAVGFYICLSTLIMWR